MGINQATHSIPTLSAISPQNNKLSLSDYPIHSICKINPKTQKPALYYMTICAPKHRIGFCMDLMDRPLKPSLLSSQTLLKKSSLNNLKSDSNMVKLKNTVLTTAGSKDDAAAAANMATLLKFFQNNVHKSFTEYPNAQMIYDKLVGSLDKNCLSDDDLAIVKTLAEEESSTNRQLISEKINEYIVNIFLENSFPEEIANSIVELMMPQVVDMFFREEKCT
ncbi:hypothetical protein EYR41_005794 [Orbilia oligospora]|uniref:Uncharacterized protein n=1 Tax=Orbilia oligospora TaxID=2813651 RepID=A0A7C8U9S0_ORBOL|nr:hypothetical protein TWF751_004374 [Orbilia oligospora]TGJ69776.1 hypothetical protein EYR41_005794 [Orbilia oligospora]